MINKYAIIDLGTNTCNLLIAKIDKEIITPIFRTSIAVKLGKGGINKRTITNEATQRAIKGINQLLSFCKEYDVIEVIAFATSAVRSADNQIQFCKKIKTETGIQLNVIDGEEEANLIYQGVTAAVPMTKKFKLILDIGGGSNEFIIGNENGAVWKQSFNIGVARIIDLFPPSDPISYNEIKKVEHYYNEQLDDLWKHTEKYPIKELIGCAGAFNTFVDLLEKIEPESKFFEAYSFNRDQFNWLYQNIVHTQRATRSQLKGMTDFRVDMVVQGTILVDLLIKKLNIDKITQSGNALREGAIQLMALEKNNWKISAI